MIKKNFTRPFIGAILLAGVAVAGIGAMLYTKPSITASSGHQQDTAAVTLHGQVVYDNAQAALPPQSMLTVQLVASVAENGGQKIIDESTKPVGDATSPLEFSLPVSKLDTDGSYALKAKISVGDTLLYANESATPIDTEHSAYRIRLVMVENRENTQTNTSRITGKTWLAEDLMGGGVIDNSHITLRIDEITDDNTLQDGKRYKAAGTGGCNTYNATLVLDEKSGVIKFDRSIPMTMMACVEAVSQQEMKFVDMLTKASSYKINEHGLLYLLDDNQNQIARFSEMQGNQ